jgi:3-hydroxyisobutyrate dehydrogenase-like beta-hydroxyacid dehydrogenase
MTAEPSPAVAVLGTGTMGAPMASNLLAAGFPVTVWDRTPERTRPLAALARQWRSATAAGLGPLDVSAARLALEPPI